MSGVRDDFYGVMAQENTEYMMPSDLDVRVAVYQHNGDLLVIGQGNRRFRIHDAVSIYLQLRDILIDDADDVAKEQSP